MKDAAVVLLVSGGTLFMVLAAVGAARLPDVYLRMQAATKASTLGLMVLAAAAALHFAELAVAARALLVVFFVFLTSPVGAHALGRAAYRAGVKPWRRP